ncbi:LPS assembly lipoprotein LptE [Luteibacter yeojuensis]|uniref:LPS-assembly lipoprotein LptE n=1 Tax=Luteibacter yeojuensis TaxID=345309 RepID=A0A0F3KI73_9GAMM|nr:LPS assembly lipoprotein LptE [Luteibacter yeojuensis]KJV30856.1 lipoprotein [Luteibacter yeojuensis]
MSPNALRVALVVAATALLGACGFHLRQSAALPQGMDKVHLTVVGGGRLERELTRAIENSNATVVDKPGAGIAELAVTSNTFRTDSLTVSGTARVTEYAVRYHVEFNAKGPDGNLLVAPQQVDMSREFSYDATNTIGTSAQTDEIQRSLINDMVQSILFRLQAARNHPPAAEPAPAPAPSAQ